MDEFIKKLIERLEEIEEHCLDMHNWKGQSAIVEAKEIVNELAEEYSSTVSKTENNGWIPCSERLPEENGLEHYEITFLSRINKTPIRSVAIFSKGRWYMPGTNCRDFDRFPFEVMAWKKPSAPYQKGE